MSASPARLVVLAPNWLGDAVMALPALADLRRAHPEAHLTVAGRGSVASLFAMVPGVDAVLTLPGRGGIAALRTWRDDAATLAGGRFDRAVLFPNSFASAWIASRAAIPERWGLATDLRARLLTRAAPKPRGAGHQAAYYQALVAAFGVANGPAYARVTPPDARPSLVPSGRYVICAPGAAYGTAKQWPPQRFAELARLVAAGGQHVVLVGSSGDHATCATIAAAAMRGGGGAVVDLCGRTTLAELAALMAGAAAVVSNDSGAMHLAGAVGAPVVAVFGATNERRTSPLTAGPEATPPAVVATSVWCRPCMLRTCPIDHRCMTSVPASRVFEAVKKVSR